jgi:phosphoheptose isomerase
MPCSDGGSAADCPHPAVEFTGRAPTCAAPSRRHARRVSTIGPLGRGGVCIAPLGAVAVVVPGEIAPRIQEARSLIGSAWCGLVERALSAR